MVEHEDSSQLNLHVHCGLKTLSGIRHKFLIGMLAASNLSYPSSKKHLHLNLWGFLTPPVEGVDLRAALDASCLRGACQFQRGFLNIFTAAATETSNSETQHTSSMITLPPVDFRAVCFVRAIAVAKEDGMVCVQET